MTKLPDDFPRWSRRDFIRAGIAAAGSVALGACVGSGNRNASLPCGSAAGLDERGTGLSSLLSAEWSREQDREAAVRWVTEHGEALKPWARRAYVNYLAPSTPERIREVYGENYPRLARVKARYDPANLFRSNQNILPA